jgi:hypothetical protein
MRPHELEALYARLNDECRDDLAALNQGRYRSLLARLKLEDQERMMK